MRTIIGGMKLACALLAAAALLAPRAAFAKSEKTVGWNASKIWPAAVRFIRVDERLKIIEKDADAGYVMFELHEEGKTFSGALELVSNDDDDGVKLVISITDRPQYIESAMMARLERKLHTELGTAPTPAPRKPAGKDNDKHDQPAGSHDDDRAPPKSDRPSQRAGDPPASDDKAAN